MRVIIRDQNGIIEDGYYKYVTSFNDVGEFDILAQHANFISLIKNYVILDKTLKSERKITIESGVLKCVNERVEIFI